MDNSHRYFENRECKYYPCHDNIENINCLFCYCPMYNLDKCPGTPEYIEKENGIRKVCTKCVFPHKAENYDTIIQILKKTGLRNQ